ncbi:MAG: preprotein translocase subunit SecY [Candidatus Buchananbacteria bacterium]
MLEKFSQIWKLKDLRNSILFVLGILVVSRIAATIPIPGIDASGLKRIFDNNQILGLMNIFSGGGMSNFSIAMMSVAPYITSSIIFQLLTMVVPSLEELSKEGEYGRNKINMWTRWLTVPLAIVQSVAMIQLLRKAGGAALFSSFTPMNMLVAVVSITAGTIFVMWLGELISEKKIGNGISLLIFAGIVSGLPGLFTQTANNFTQAEIINTVVFAAIALVTIIGVVIVTEGQRNIPVQYARQMRGGRTVGGTSTHLPLRVNMAGVIPIIFAISLIIMPQTIAQLFTQAKTEAVAHAAQWVIMLFSNQWFYGGAYFVLVVAFTYFYTAVVFHPDQVAENLQKQGGFVPGTRPGKPTAEYLQNIVSRIVLTGALFLGVIAVLPMITAGLAGTKSMTIGGTSLLIVVSVVIETVNQINAQLAMRDYEEI